MKKELGLGKLEKLFYEKTFSDVSRQNIANFLNIKKSSVYYYFPSKEKLIKEVLNYSFDNYKTFIENIPTNNLKNLIYDFIEFPNKSKNLFSIIAQK
jgi:AcrR family transcriptional regulator